MEEAVENMKEAVEDMEEGSAVAGDGEVCEGGEGEGGGDGDGVDGEVCDGREGEGGGDGDGGDARAVLDVRAVAAIATVWGIKATAADNGRSAKVCTSPSR